MPLKLVQSFWSKPAFFEKKQRYYNSRKTAGWLNMRYFLLSSGLSCLTGRRHHKKIELHTDRKGAEIFVDILKLPYDQVYLTLDALDDADHRLWVQGKFKTFESQSEPFLHIDNDIFLWDELFPSSASRLYAQSNIEIWPYYKQTLDFVFSEFDYLPPCFQDLKISLRTREANTGVIGGHDLEFFQEYCAMAKTFWDKNQSSLPKIDIGYLNTIIEQLLYTCMARKKKIKIDYAFSNYKKTACNELLRFNRVPLIDKFIHLVGEAKKSRMMCEQLELRMRHEFPREYKQLRAAIYEHFPETEEQDILTGKRKQILEKNLKAVYSHDIESLKRQKIMLSSHAELTEKCSSSGGQTDIYLSNPYSDTSKKGRQKLKGQDIILAYFNQPVSIAEILEAVSSQGPVSDQELKKTSDRMVEFVTRKIVLDGVLSFV